MTPRERVRRTRMTIIGALAASALLWGVVSFFFVMLSAVLLDVVVGLSRPVRLLVVPMAVAIAVLVVARLTWRARRACSLLATALWIEERVPSLQYALVSSIERVHEHAVPLLDRHVNAIRWERSLLPRALARRLLPPVTALLAALALLIAVPEGSVARVRSPEIGDAILRTPHRARARANRLEPLVARVTPPAYTGLPARSLEEPESIVALEGSRIEIVGRGAADGLSATRGDEPIPVLAGYGDRWRIPFVMPGTPTALRLRDGPFDRLVVLDAQRDSAPVVTLTVPARDTILREPTGAITLRGEARDALGLAQTWAEYIVSSGQGESFRFRSGILARNAHQGARTATLAATVSMDSLRLAPGDVVHLRLVAHDLNPARDAGTGASETRVVRIARAGEYDSVAVEGAPPPDADTSAISQRMLILLTEALVERESRLPRDTVVREARAIAVDQTRLRRRVGEIIFSRLTGEEGAEHSHDEAVERRGEMTAEELLRAAEEATEHGAGEVLDFAEGESPVVAINTPLLEAYNAMWSAAGELNVGAPRRALPHMYEALAAIERARQAERVYLRGRPAVVVVDVNRARLAGQRDSLPPARRAARDDTTTAPPVRFARALALTATAPASAIDSLLLLRVELLADRPAAAAALGDAIHALRMGRDAAPALARARAAIAGEVRREETLRAWGAGW